VTAQHSVEELVVLLNQAGVPTGPINNIGEGFEDQQVKYLEIAKPAPHPELGDLDLVRSPINLSKFPQPEKFDNAAPDPGIDSEVVLKDLGIEKAQIIQLREQGVIS
jgi:crotonobetainyl-CoA:carnitine CoA-transferase CaiB-like acyl-CoA transferase